MISRRLLVLSFVGLMLAWVGYVGWMSRQAASADVASGVETPQRISRIEAAIRQAEDDIIR